MTGDARTTLSLCRRPRKPFFLSRIKILGGEPWVPIAAVTRKSGKNNNGNKTYQHIGFNKILNPAVSLCICPKVQFPTPIEEGYQFRLPPDSILWSWGETLWPRFNRARAFDDGQSWAWRP